MLYPGTAWMPALLSRFDIASSKSVRMAGLSLMPMTSTFWKCCPAYVGLVTLATSLVLLHVPIEDAVNTTANTIANGFKVSPESVWRDRRIVQGRLGTPAQAALERGTHAWTDSCA